MQPLSLLSILAPLSLLPALSHSTTCNPYVSPISGIQAPAPKAVLTIGRPFNVSYCSSFYARGSAPVSIDVVVYKCGDKVGATCGLFTEGEEIVHEAKAVQGETFGYEFNATVWEGFGQPRPGQWALGIIEHAVGYIYQYQVKQSHVPVTFQGPFYP